MSTPNPKRSSYLPEDVIFEILVRLPVKTLLRFKCVCKKWNAVIASDNFVKQHYVHGSNKERLLVCCYKRDCRTYGLSVDDTFSAFEEPAYLQLLDKVWVVREVQNGILYLTGIPWKISKSNTSREMALYNPATRQLKILPPHPVVRSNYRQFTLFGFGLDSLSGDYKVVAIFYKCDCIRQEILHSEVYVYNSSSDSWKNVTAFKSSPHVAHSSGCNQYLNGVYYWALGNTSILAFDMSTEKFEVIQISELVQPKILRICARGDSLVLLAHEPVPSGKFEVWVMDMERRLNRVAVVGPLPYLPFSLWKNDELLLHLGSSNCLSIYNIFTKQIRFPVATELEQENQVTTEIISYYKESLVPIKGNRMLWGASADI